MNLIKKLENIEILNLKKNINYNFNVGDIIIIEIINNIKTKKIKTIKGMVIAKYNKNLNSSFLLRNIVNGVWIERNIKLYSPLIKNINIKFKNKIKKSKLYYLKKI